MEEMRELMEGRMEEIIRAWHRPDLGKEPVMQKRRHLRLGT
jgi:hypothetical protein